MSSATPTASIHTLPRKQPIDYQEAAQMLGLNKTTLRTLVCRKQIPHLRLGPRTVRFDPAALEWWLELRSVGVAGEEENPKRATAKPPRRRQARSAR